MHADIPRQMLYIEWLTVKINTKKLTGQLKKIILKVTCALTSAVSALSGQPLTQAKTLLKLCSRQGRRRDTHWPCLTKSIMG